MTKIIIALLILAFGIGGYVIGTRYGNQAPIITTTPQSTPFADDKVQIDEPLPGSQVSSPLTIRGRARGTWYFEASFPVTLTDWDGRIIAQAPAQAKTDWMTPDWVDFEVTLTFIKPSYSNRGTLILQKDNPSGLPEHDDAREITIFFK